MLTGYVVSVLETTGVSEERQNSVMPRSLTLGIPCKGMGRLLFTRKVSWDELCSSAVLCNANKLLQYMKMEISSLGAYF
jgi:hypothetical protein